MKKVYTVRATNNFTGEVWEMSVKCRSRYRAVKKLTRHLHILKLAHAAGVDYDRIDVMEANND